jgi:hypothetical protein
LVRDYSVGLTGHVGDDGEAPRRRIELQHAQHLAGFFVIRSEAEHDEIGTAAANRHVGRIAAVVEFDVEARAGQHGLNAG